MIGRETCCLLQWHSYLLPTLARLMRGEIRTVKLPLRATRFRLKVPLRNVPSNRLPDVVIPLAGDELPYGPTRSVINSGLTVTFAT